MKLLVCGEGAHDIGVPDHWDVRREAYVELEGWMQPMIRLAMIELPEFSVRNRSDLQLQASGGRRRPLPPGHGSKAYLAKRAALTGGYDGVIFMADADTTDVREWRRIVDEIETGFAALDGDLCCVACVPMATSESWLLSDPDAWLAAFGYAGADSGVPPESIWGARNDPAGNHPHRLFYRICMAAGVMDDRETRLRIAEALELATARARCPISMEPFIAMLESC